MRELAAAMSRLNPLKTEVNWNGDGTIQNQGFESTQAFDFRRTNVTRKQSRISKPALLFRGRDEIWYFDNDLEREADAARVLSAGVPAFIPATPLPGIEDL